MSEFYCTHCKKTFDCNEGQEAAEHGLYLSVIDIKGKCVKEIKTTCRGLMKPFNCPSLKESVNWMPDM